MPVNAKAVVDIEVNDKSFKEFQNAFDKYVKLLQRTPAAWKQVGGEQKALVQSIQQGTAALMAQNEVMRKNAAHAKDVAVHTETAAFHWDKIRDRAGKFKDFVFSAHEKIMKWAGIFGGLATGMGAATGWGLYGLGQWVRGGQNAAARVDMGTSELRTVKTTIGDPYGIDVEKIAKMVTTAAGAPNSPEYIALKGRLGLEAGSMQGTHKVTDVIEGLIRLVEGGMTPEMVAQQTGGQFDAGEIHSMVRNKAAIREAARNAPDEAERTKVDPKTEKAWNDFITRLEQAAEELKGILVVGLTPILNLIGANSKQWLDSLREFMKPDGDFQKFLRDELPGLIERLKKGVVGFAEMIESGLKLLGFIPRSEKEQADHEYNVLRNANRYSEMSPAQKKRYDDEAQANRDLIAGTAKKWVDWSLGGSREHREEFNAQSASGAAARIAERKATEDRILNKFDEFFTYLRTGKQPEGSHQDGTPFVNKTGTYKLHRGEMVLPEADADLLRHSTMNDWKRAITGIESGGNYGIVNSRSGATGKYQVMPGNIPSWTRAALGYAMSQEQFRANPAAQERVFEYMFGQYVSQYGNPIDAASAWFSGQPFAGNKAGPDAMGTTVPGYIKSFLAGLGTSSSGRMSVDINDNTGGNVSLALAQAGGGGATVGIPVHPI